jgi:integrase
LIAFGEVRGWVHLQSVQRASASNRRERARPDRRSIRSGDADHCDEARGRAALGFAVYAGLRLGELLALDVAAVDIEGGWIHVHRSWDREGKQFVATKSCKPRKVPIIDKLGVLLMEHFVLPNRPSNGLIFPSANKPEWPTDPGILRRRTDKRWKDAGLKPLDPP